jgi:hypothetical protein
VGGDDAQAGYDEFFAQQRREKTWGLVIFRLKSGEVVQVKMETSFKDVKDALKRRSTETPDSPE